MRHTLRKELGFFQRGTCLDAHAGVSCKAFAPAITCPHLATCSAQGAEVHVLYPAWAPVPMGKPTAFVAETLTMTMPAAVCEARGLALPREAAADVAAAAGLICIGFRV